MDEVSIQERRQAADIIKNLRASIKGRHIIAQNLGIKDIYVSMIANITMNYADKYCAPRWAIRKVIAWAKSP